MNYALSFRATPAQQRVLDAITGLTRKLGYPPTVQEICDALGFRSKNAAHDHLRRLRVKGLVTWEQSKLNGGGASRTLRVVTEPGEAFPVRRCDSCERDVMVVDGRCYLCESRVDARSTVQHITSECRRPPASSSSSFSNLAHG